MSNEKKEAYSKECNDFGIRINQLLQSLEITQAEFADTIGVSRVAVSMWCRCLQKPGESSIREICKKFNVDYNWLKYGKFQMFLSIGDKEAYNLKIKYNLSDDDYAYIKTFLESSSDVRRSLILFNKQFINNLEKISQGK